MMSILQMIEATSGNIRIDDVDVSSIRRESLRSCLNIVPQDPFFLVGSVRFNLDPQGRCTDDQIQSALEEVELWNKMMALKGDGRSSAKDSLDQDLDASAWSQGERQLLCLTRALLNPSRIVILDEASSK